MTASSRPKGVNVSAQGLRKDNNGLIPCEKEMKGGVQRKANCENFCRVIVVKTQNIFLKTKSVNSLL